MTRITAAGRSGLRASERGAVVIYVAIASLFLVAFTSLVVDYGVLWVARAQAQNAADAGAFAGVTALIFEDFLDQAPARQSAIAVAQQNPVWGESPVVTPADVSFPIIDDCFAAGMLDTACVRVDVFRNQERANPLPTFFAKLFGVTEQGVRATATAWAAPANVSDCMKPWAIPDKWEEMNPVPFGPWNAGSTFVPPDSYDPPGPSGAGTGLRYLVHRGLQVVLTEGTMATPISPGHFFKLDLPNAALPDEDNNYQINIETCNGVQIAIGDTVVVEPAATPTQTIDGANSLIAQDPTAEWDAANNRVINSCANNNPPCARTSPRMVAIPIFNTLEFENSRIMIPEPNLQIVNIAGFFIDEVVGSTIVGYLAAYPGILRNDTPSVHPLAAFSWSGVLIR